MRNSKKKKNDNMTILWGQFRDQAQNLNSLGLTPRENSLNEGQWLREALSWMEGDQFQVNDFLKPDFADTSWKIPKSSHDEVCPIFKAAGFLNKRNTLSSLVKKDPRWMFDRCAVELYFQAANEINYRFFNEIGEHLAKSKMIRTKNDLDHLRWFVNQKLPPFLIYIIPESERKATISKILNSAYDDVLLVIESKPELRPLKNQSVLKTVKNFRETCLKWYLKN